MLHVREFKGKEEGKKLLILGAVHGNEPCGAWASRMIINSLEAK